MSLSFQPLEAVCCIDELVNVEQQRTYGVIKSGSQTTYKPFPTTAISNSSLTFTCPPPSAGVFVSRKQYLYCPVRLTFTGIPPVGQSIIMPNRDAPRAFPISSIIDTLQITINNQSVAINIADIIHAMAHYNTDEDCKNLDYSTFPSYQDQSQVYGDLFLSNRSPLSTYGTSQDGTQIGRAGFPGMVIFSNPVQTVAGTLLTSIVDLASCEPLFLSPLYFGKGNACGFFNVSSLDYNFTLIGQAGNRLWSHDDNGGTNVITSITMTMGGLNGGPSSFAGVGGNLPTLLFQYVTPLETQVIPPDVPITYPYFDIQRYPTDQFLFPPGMVDTVKSNNLQISSVPRKMYIYVRQRNSDLYASSTNTDTFFQIQNVNIQFLNNTGLLAPQTMQQLYLMCVKNGCKMGWQQWSGGPCYSNDFTGQIGTVGSVVCVEFCTDIGMANPLLTAGVLNQCMIQVNATVKNVSSNPLGIFPTLYIIMVLEGSFTVQSVGAACLNQGCLSPNDVLECHNKPGVSLADVQNVSGSGDFWSGLKDFGSKLYNFIKKNQVVSRGLSLIPHPAAQVGSRVARAVGFGEGGARLSRAHMRRRLHQY